MITYLYTAMEGGKWNQLLSESNVTEAETELRKTVANNQARLFERPIHSVRFPDGRLWDSYVGDFVHNPYL